MSRLTEKVIVSSFMELLKQKSLDKITVKEIIEAADVNRNTFYYHYEDIYDLLESIFTDEAERFLREVQGESSFYDQYVRAAGFFIENHEAVLHIYESKSRPVLHRYLTTTLKHLIEIYVQKAAEGTPLSDKGRDFIVSFYTYGIVGATMEWIEDGMPDHRSGLMRTIGDSFQMTLSIIIQTYIQGHPEECR